MNWRAGILIFGIAGAICFLCIDRTPDPIFNERATSAWVHDLVDPDKQREAFDAIRKIGKPAALHLAKTLPFSAAEAAWIPRSWRKQLARLDHADSELAAQKRARALAALGQLGPSASPALPQLVQLLGEAPEETAPDITYVLRRIGPAAAVELCRALRANSESTRARAAKTLQDFRVSKEVCDALTRAVADRSARVRASAVESLGVLGGAKTDPLVRALVDPAPQVRAKACEALGRSNDHDAIPCLVELFYDPDPAVQFEAARAVWKLSGDTHRTLPIFVSLLKTSESWRAAHALGEMRDEAAPAVPALIRAMSREQVPRPFRSPASVTFALGRIPAAAPALTQTLLADQAPLRMNALLALAMLGDAAAASADRVMLSLNDPERDVRVAAALTLGVIGSRDERAVAALEECLYSEDIFIRSRALHLLRKIAPERDWAAASE